jgi:hypothetical protein
MPLSATAVGVSFVVSCWNVGTAGRRESEIWVGQVRFSELLRLALASRLVRGLEADAVSGAQRGPAAAPGGREVHRGEDLESSDDCDHPDGPRCKSLFGMITVGTAVGATALVALILGDGWIPFQSNPDKGGRRVAR